MADIEHYSGRTFTRTPECHFCYEPAEWSVTEDSSGEQMYACDWCKYKAFS